MAHYRSMSDSSVLDLIKLRRGCTYCSVRQLCLPGGIGAEELQRLDDIVQRRKPIARGDRLFRIGDPLSAVYVARDGAFKSVSITRTRPVRSTGINSAWIGLAPLAGRKRSN